MIKSVLQRLARNQRGATAIEYGMLVALIAIACIGAFSQLGNSQALGFQGVLDKISTTLSAG
ncbi:MAG: Flp family type IVb pilin [Proteobacteria bacterium]|nr:Flp family type IVb pilin [Pseudomonadota bacterium]